MVNKGKCLNFRFICENIKWQKEGEADHLKARNSVVVNFKRVTTDQAKRIIDFLSGTLYAINGDLQKIGDGIYLCTPKNIDVQGKITEENESQEDYME